MAKQRPVSAQEAAVKARGWKSIRWRQGTKGWLESRFVAVRVQPSHGFVHGQPPHKQVWLLVEWPESEKEPTKILSLRSAPNLQPPPLSAFGEVPAGKLSKTINN